MFSTILVAARVADHSSQTAAGPVDFVVVGAVQVAVDPQIGEADEVVVVVTERRCAFDETVARVSRSLAGAKVRDGHRLAGERCVEGVSKPRSLLQPKLSHSFGVEESSPPGTAHDSKVGLTSLHTTLSLVLAEQIKVCPSGDTHEANAIDLHYIAIEIGDPERLRGLAKFNVGFVDVLLVVLVVTGDKDHSRWPVGKPLKNVGGVAEIARHYREVCAHNRVGGVSGNELEVEVRQNLYVHRQADK